MITFQIDLLHCQLIVLLLLSIISVPSSGFPAGEQQLTATMALYYILYIVYSEIASNNLGGSIKFYANDGKPLFLRTLHGLPWPC
jgi:hypothetical protein